MLFNPFRIFILKKNLKLLRFFLEFVIVKLTNFSFEIKNRYIHIEMHTYDFRWSVLKLKFQNFTNIYPLFIIRRRFFCFTLVLWKLSRRKFGKKVFEICPHGHQGIIWMGLIPTEHNFWPFIKQKLILLSWKFSFSNYGYFLEQSFNWSMKFLSLIFFEMVAENVPLVAEYVKPSLVGFGKTVNSRII